MGARGTERVKFYKENFMTLHDQGYLIPEIAEKSGITPRYGYMLLQEIADEHGVKREELLKIPNRKHQSSVSFTKASIQVVNSEELRKEFEETIINIDSILGNIEKMMEV